MAAIDFPNSPTDGQQFIAPNGVTYVFSASPAPGYWKTSAGPSIYVGITPPASPYPNQLYWNSELGVLFIWYNDGNSTQWVPVSPVPSAGSGVGIILYWSSGSAALNTAATLFGWDVTAFNNTGGVYSGGSFTVPPGGGGLWDVNIGVSCTNASGGAGVAHLYVNGVEVISSLAALNASGSTVGLNTKIRLNAGDAVALYMHGSTGTTAYGTSGAIRQSWMNLTRVGN